MKSRSSLARMYRCCADDPLRKLQGARRETATFQPIVRGPRIRVLGINGTENRVTVTHGVAAVRPTRLGCIVQRVGGIPQWSKVALCHRLRH